MPAGGGSDADGRVVIVGGGIGGLLSAAALARRFARVTLVERDVYPDRPVPRQGVAQGRCLHMLMAGGQRIFERLVPGFGAALEDAGASAFDVGRDAAVRLAHGWLPREPAGISMLAASRALIEHVLRDRVQRRPGLELLPGHAVRGLLVDPDARRVLGVQGDVAGEPFERRAELTVVATGRGSTLEAWLRPLGVSSVPGTVLPTEHRYVSRWYAIPPGGGTDWRLLSIAPAPGTPSGGAIFEAEGNRWGVVLSVPRSEPVPQDDEGFARVCRSLADPRLAEALEGAQPLGPVARHQRTDNRRRHFERISPWPRGVVAVGDAVCMLDPYFGLGMTACARGVEAMVEHAWEESGSEGRFMARVAESGRDPWTLATEHRSGGFSSRDDYARQSLLRLAPRSPALARLMLRRMHMLDPPDVLLRPESLSLVRRVAGV